MPSVYFQKSIKKDQNYLSKNILLEMERLAATYHSVISLILAMEIWLPPIRKTDHGNFTKHLWLKAWRQNEELKKSGPEGALGREGRMEQGARLVSDVLKEEETYKNLSMQKILMKNHKKRSSSI